ncbi:unnamed protein product [Malus baccata var. baccata]
MAADNRTIKELSASGLDNAAPLCIQYPMATLGKTDEFELKSSLLHHIPKYHGLSMEDPNKHLKEFEVVCSSMTPVNVDGSILKMKAFPFSLMDKAKDWLYELAPETVTSWESMKRAFLESFSQLLESFSYVKRLVHQMKEELLLQYFYEGLLPLERQMLDASPGGALVDKTPMAAKILFANRGLNAQQYEGVGQRGPPRKQVHEMAEGMRMQGPMVCGVCSIQRHASEKCPQLIENGGWESVNAIRFQGQNQPRNDPYSNTYNPGWRDHPNFKWREAQQPQQQGGFRQQPPGFFTKPYAPPHVPQQSAPNTSGTSLDNDTLFKLLTNLSQGQENQTKAMQSQDKRVDQLEKQIGQIVDFVSKFRDPGQLPSSTIPNPKGGFESAKAILLRSGKEVGAGPKPSTSGLKEDEKLQFEEEDTSPPTAKVNTPLPQASIGPNLSNSANKGKNVSNSLPTNVFPSNVPFPSRFMHTKKEEAERDILETFRKVQVNIPLLDAIKQVPRYAKFLKELCTTRKRMSTKEVVKVGENVSAILQRKLPPKCKDPGSFTIPCVIGNTRFESAMLDLGASINVMPYSMYASMNLGVLKNDGVIIQLADRSNAYPKGVLEDVNHLIFPADFYVLEMDESNHTPSLPILLGRPFMKTTRTKIDVFNGTLSMEFDGEVVNFNLSDSIKYPSEDHSCFSIDIIDSLAQGYLEDLNDDVLEKVITRGMELKTMDGDPMHTHRTHESFHAVASSEEFIELVAALESLPMHGGKSPNFDSIPISTNKLLPSIIQAPVLELKPLPSHLKYIFLGENETLPAIIFSSLTALEEEKLVRVLKEFKAALGWTLADIKGISPTTCMHHIFLEEGAKPTREAQRRLNPQMMEVVKTEIIKLLDCGVIYPISDSRWVSPIQCVPKKSGMTVVENVENELVPTRIQIGWRVCIDYRKLNATTRKDHFPLPFLDQMLERLAGHSFYCFLDGYSGYNQIVIAPDDQEKTTFTCPFGTFAYRRMPFEKGIEVDKSKIDLVRYLPSPTSVREDFSKIAQPLRRLLQKEVSFEFNEACEQAFNHLKDLLTSAPIITPPDWSTPFELMCDALDYAIGAVLGQRKNKLPHVIYYASRTLNDAQLNYSTTEKELLAVVFALDKFGLYLIGTKDKKGSDNVVADHLSRLVREEEPIPISEMFLDEQLLSIEVSTPWYADLVNYLVTKQVPHTLNKSQHDKLKHDARFYVWDDPYVWKYCPYQIVKRCVPNSEFNSILAFCHSYACGGHFGTQRTALKVLECGFYWPTLFKDARMFCLTCDRCQRTGTIGAKDQIPQTPIFNVEIFYVWGIDFMGHFPSSFGFTYILLAVDYVSKWVEAKATRTNDSRVVSDFIKTNIFSRFGMPRVFKSDGSSHFCNRTIEALFKKYNVTHKASTPYHPQTNGQAEVSNREIKQILEQTVGPTRKD